MESENNTQKTIMLVDDTESNIDMMMAILKDYDLIPTTSGEDAVELLGEEKVDLILMDIVMPGMNGFEACQTLKANPATRDIPVIFITSKTDEESVEEAYEAGGIDYVTKPFKPRELLARVKTQLKMYDLICSLDYLATHDTLTGIYNRRKFFELAGEMYTGRENVFGVMIDIDHFKQINDEYGHDAGDVALKSITRTIGELLPEGAVFGRMGGEEFAVLMESESADTAMESVEKIRVAVSEARVDHDAKTIQCTISNGLAQKGLNSSSLDGLLREADAALYQAKNTGRNKAIFRENG